MLKNDERKKLAELGLGQHIQTSNISLLRQVEVDEIIEGNEEKYKSSNTPSVPTSELGSSKDSRIKKPMHYVPPLPTSSHLDAVPQATPIQKSRIRRAPMFPFCLEEDASAMASAAATKEVLVPIRLDMDIEGQKLRDTFTWNKNG
jgi:SWI/SNF-related matrix-associated actin-dependent regulator of chromatin subfamily B protein 1